jgi:hypothetical protein
MTDQIITEDHIRAKARSAFDRGVGRDEHQFNWHSTAAIQVWQAEWDRCAVEQQAEQVTA